MSQERIIFLNGDRDGNDEIDDEILQPQPNTLVDAVNVNHPNPSNLGNNLPDKEGNSYQKEEKATEGEGTNPEYNTEYGHVSDGSSDLDDEEEGDKAFAGGASDDEDDSDNESTDTDKIIRMLPEYNVLARFLTPSQQDDDDEDGKNITDFLQGIEKQLVTLNTTLETILKVVKQRSMV